MCQSKARGGKRCFSHSNYTKATSLHISKMVGASEEEVTSVMRELRKEGKDTPAPTSEEYTEHVNRQIFTAKNDESLSPHDQKIITNRWHKARSERPDGGAWHAMKNALGAMLSRARTKAAAVFGIGVLSFSLAGCGGALSDSDPAPEPSVSASQSVDDDKDTTEELKSADGVVAGENANDGNGDYAQLTLSKDSPLLTEDATKVAKKVAENYSDEEVSSAQAFVSEFAVSEGLDSIVSDVSSKENSAEWRRANSHLIHPSIQEDLQEDFQKTGFLWVNTGDRGVPAYEKGQSKFTSVDASLDKVWVDKGSNALVFDYTFKTTRDVTDPDPKTDDGTVYVEQGVGKMSYSVLPDGDDWDINGWNTNYKYEVTGEK